MDGIKVSGEHCSVACFIRSESYIQCAIWATPGRLSSAAVTSSTIFPKHQRKYQMCEKDDPGLNVASLYKILFPIENHSESLLHIRVVRSWHIKCQFTINQSNNTWLYFGNVTFCALLCYYFKWGLMFCTILAPCAKSLGSVRLGAFCTTQTVVNIDPPIQYLIILEKITRVH